MENSCFVGGAKEKKKDLWIDPFYNEKERKEIEKVCDKNPQILKLEDLFINIDNDKKIGVKYRETGFDLFRLYTHDGQRKLLLNEIYFLTEYGHLSNTIVYAGSAAGYHINTLIKLFPLHKFILWDPRKFSSDLYTHLQVETHNEFFTSEVAKTYRNAKCLFISDIRLTPEEEQVSKDMRMQMDWVLEMQPLAFMLKFRPPWDNEPIEYLDGEIMFQPYPPKASSETRLIASSPETGKYKTRIYEVENYDNLLYLHNSIIRQWAFYKNNFGLTEKNKKGRNNLWDCVAELLILKNYCEKKNKNINDVLTTINDALMGRHIYKLDPYLIEDKNPCQNRKEIYDKYYKRYKKGDNQFDKFKKNN